MLKIHLFGVLIFILGNIYAQTTSIPDLNFEQELINLGIDTDRMLNGSVATSDISGIRTLDISFKFISNLTGIEGFESLEFLDCSENLISSLNLRSNTELVELKIIRNFIKKINLNHNIKLMHLSIYDNQISKLDLTHNSDLEELFCYYNELSELKLANNAKLKHIVVHHNLLTTLDVSTETELETLLVNDNDLDALNIKNGNNAAIKIFNASSNPSLTCVQVDNAADANTGMGNYGYWVKDSRAIYSEECQAFLGIEDSDLSRVVNLYPNPVLHNLSIESEQVLTKVEIYSVLGQRIKQIHTDFNSIRMDDLSKGVYWIKIQSKKNYTVRKLVKR